MRKISTLVLGAAFMAGAGVFVSSSASALPLGAGASSAFDLDTSLIQQVQSRRVVRVAPPPRGVVVRRGRGISPGAAIAGAAAIGIIGAAAAAAAASRSEPQYYYAPQPVYAPRPACYVEEQPVYDRYGNYRGVRPVQVCQ